jgi:Holliday junction resolvase RusA-like endonuclease
MDGVRGSASIARRIAFTVPGDPVPKGRARVAVTAAGKVRPYTPKRTHEYEDAIGNAWIGEGPRPPQFAGAVRVSIRVRERVYPSDLDNYVKAVLDALNGLAWADDRQVEVIDATIERKQQEPGIDVTIEDAGGGLSLGL